MADLMVRPAAIQLLECFRTALVAQHGSTLMPAGSMPTEVCFRVGESVSADASVYQDLCCSGLAWVRITDIFGAAQDFPAPDTSVVISGCGPLAWGATFELGVIRCAPTGDEYTVPTCDDWTLLQEFIWLDQAAMRQAMCCMVGLYDPGTFAIGSWNPLPTSGGCAGGTWNLQMLFDCGDCA